MEKTKPVVAIDFDGVLNNMLDLWVKRLNEKYDLKFNPEDIKYWDMSKTFTMIPNEQIYTPLYSEDFWCNVTQAFFAKYVIERLKNQNFNVVIVTATDFCMCNDKIYNCILRLFPIIHEKDIIICHDKSLIRCDYIIDDYEENLANNNGYRILIDKSYNVNADKSKYDYRAQDLHDAMIQIMTQEIIKSKGVNNNAKD